MLRLLVLVVTVGVLGGQLGRALTVLDLLNAALPLLLTSLALLVAAALRWRDRVATWIGLLGLVVGAAQFLSACFPAGFLDRQGSSGANLRILTVSTWHSNRHPSSIRELVEAEQPDIALLQETNRNTAEVVARLLPRFHRVKSCRAQHCSLTILSRWPIQRILQPARRGAPLADILVAQVDAPPPVGRLRVINVHLPRPNHGDASEFNRQLVQASLRSARQPLIVAGDFNIATGSFGLIRFAEDTGLRRVEGYLLTYPAHLMTPALMGIDHLFASHHWAAQACRRTGPGGSDHYGIVCFMGMHAKES